MYEFCCGMIPNYRLMRGKINVFCENCKIRSFSKNKVSSFKDWSDLLEKRRTAPIIIKESLWNTSGNDARLFDGKKYDVFGFWALARGCSHLDIYNKPWMTSVYPKVPDDLEWLFQEANWGRSQFSAQKLIAYLSAEENFSKPKIKINLAKVFSSVNLKITYEL